MTYRLFIQANQKTYFISLVQIITYIISIILIVILANSGANTHIIKLVSDAIFILRPFLQNIYVKKIDLKDANSNFEIKQKWDGLA